MKIALLTLLLLQTAVVFAKGITNLPRARMDDAGFQQWAKEFEKRFFEIPGPERVSHGECREAGLDAGADDPTKPITILCLVSDQRDIAAFQGRASIYAEGAGVGLAGQVVGKGTLVDRRSVIEQVYSTRIGGTDIQSRELTEFYEKIEDACLCPSCENVSLCPSANTCLDSIEQEFFEKVVAPRIANGRPFVVITTPFNRPDFAGHELRHAQYFSDEGYRARVDDFYNNVLTDTERATIRAEIGKDYDASDEYLVRNEFQAYALAKQDQIPLSKQFGARLLAHLKAGSIVPIQIDPPPPVLTPTDVDVIHDGPSVDDVWKLKQRPGSEAPN